MKTYDLPEKVKALTPYTPAQGTFVLRLNANESFITLPEHIRQEVAQALSAVDFRRYPDPACGKTVESFARYFQVPSTSVVAGNGSDELIGLLVSWFLSEGDVLVTVPPDFDMYGFYAQIIGAKVKTFTKDEWNLTFDARGLAEFAKEQRANMVMLSNPCNPTSTQASRQDILYLLETLDCMVVIDEAYMEFGDDSILDLVGTYENLVVLKTCSKAFGMAAIRLGFAVCAEHVAKALSAAKSPFNVNSMTQAVGEVLFSHPEYLKDCCAKIRSARDDLYEQLSVLAKETDAIEQVYATKANFVLMRMKDCEDVYRRLLAQGAAVRLMKGYLRITAGSFEENALLIEFLRKALEQ